MDDHYYNSQVMQQCWLLLVTNDPSESHWWQGKATATTRIRLGGAVALGLTLKRHILGEVLLCSRIRDDSYPFAVLLGVDDHVAALKVLGLVFDHLARRVGQPLLQFADRGA